MQFSTPRDRVLATAAYYAAMLTLGFGTAVIGPTLAGLSQQAHTSLAAVGIVFTASSIGYLLGSLQSGRWFDRLRGHRVLAIALLLVAVSLGLVPSATSLFALVAIFLLLGAATATIDVGTNTLLLWIYRDRVGGVMNGLHFCFGVGALVAPAIVAWSIRGSNDVAMAYWVLALVSLPIASVLLLIPAAPDPVRSTSQTASSTHFRLIALVAAVFACYVGAEVAYGGWISTYGVELGFGDAADTAYLASVFWGMLTFGRLLAIPIAARVRATTIIAIDFAVALLCIVAILCLPHSAPVLWIATGFFGLFLASIYPTLLVFSGERMQVSGQSTSWYMAASSIGSMTLPWIAGRSFVALGPSSLLWLIGVVLLLGGYAFWLATVQRQPMQSEPTNTSRGMP